MAKFEVHCTCSETQSWEEVYEIEADSESEAIEIAEKQFYDAKAAGELEPWFSDDGESFAEEIEE